MTNKTYQTYQNPFVSGTMGSKKYRIPAILTLNDGSVIAAADMRYDHGADSPNNIDTLVAISNDGYNDWAYNSINHFDDYADTYNDKNSASFIDSAIGQSKRTGRIFIVTDAYPSGGGLFTSKTGSGFVKYNDRSYLGLGKRDTKLCTRFVGEFTGDFAPVLSLSDGSKTKYSVDREYNLYKDSKPLLMPQKGSDKQVHQNVFFKDAHYHCLCTTYLWLRYSDDNGKTWSSPKIINYNVKGEDQFFLGVCPGRMCVTEYKGKERIIFTAYTRSKIGAEHVTVVISDNNGESWYNPHIDGYACKNTLAVGKTSECQIVELNNGILRMFCRNKGYYVAYCDSNDGGITWTKVHAIDKLPANANCMMSFINTSKLIDGKKVIIGSFASNQSKRANGLVVLGTVNNDNSINWISEYRVNNSFFAYSCLTELSDGNIGFLYEDEPDKISYKILSVSDNGEISEINGDNYNGTFNNKPKGIKSLTINSVTKLYKLFNSF